MATSRLNKLYIELLKDNPDWGTSDRRADMNHFMARLIFCFFAEDTDIFLGENLFTSTIDQMSARDSSNTHEVIGELFKAMNTKVADRAESDTPRWANALAEYQCDVLYRGRKEALTEFLPLDAMNWITSGNALRLDWLSICPPTGAAVKFRANDLFHSPLDQAQIDFEELGSLHHIDELAFSRRVALDIQLSRSQGRMSC